jgi:ElaB/YqjD/DUF883 family membrane-anchored ribosome-binding protein
MTEVESAEARITEARQRLFATLGEVQARMRPSALAQDAVESAAQGVASVARKGAEAVRKRPVALAAVAGTIGLVMARGWIADIVRNRRRKGHETGEAPDRSKAKPSPGAKKGRAT